ncbi:asparagine synthase-related protein [Kitasatospora sp. NPDC056651]|uniref:asparagine synthase-related protein n=1 Tax=Kitasatospora sp. NPDC056651 TaxID=3345892 RepID=UPI0036BB1D53
MIHRTNASVTPAAVAFAVTAAAAPGDLPRTPREPRLAARGHLTPLHHRALGHAWDGWTLALEEHPDGAARAHTGRVSVLLAGELHNRAELARATGLGTGAGTGTGVGTGTGTGPYEGGDAELLAHAYARYGEHVLRMLNGRYALLLCDGPLLLAATDHAGGVPLYLHRTGAAVRLATEAKALLHPGDHTGTPPAGLLPVRGSQEVRQVPAGTAAVLHLETGAARTFTTWTPSPARHLPTPDQAVTRTREALERAVRTRLPAAGTPTAVLSGGIDSSTVAALAAGAGHGLETVSMGTDLGDEFAAARLVADHLGARHPGLRHTEITLTTGELLAELPWAVWAAEVTDPDIIEYLLPLVALYRRLDGPPRRILTGYGADIPLGGMHRHARHLPELDDLVAHDMAHFDGLNEMSPTLAAIAGHWTTHPYWDRDVLDTLLPLEAGLKHRDGIDKWVLRRAAADVLPAETVRRPKLGVHEGSGTTSALDRLFLAHGTAPDRVRQARRQALDALYDTLVAGPAHPDDIPLDDFLKGLPA